MTVQYLDSNVARLNWRAILDTIKSERSHTVIERYGKPVAVVIPFDEYEELAEVLSVSDGSPLQPRNTSPLSSSQEAPPHPILRFAGAWADLPDAEFDVLLDDLQTRRMMPNLRRTRDATSID